MFPNLILNVMLMRIEVVLLMYETLCNWLIQNYRVVTKIYLQNNSYIEDPLYI